jgi:cephalosporin hydroxylase
MRGPEPQDAGTVSAFSTLYWIDRAPWTATKWRGVGVAKCPLDLFVYQEILFETRPQLLIETGSCIGGSALFYASIFDMIGMGKVVTVDKDAYPHQPQHPRIDYLVGSSVDEWIASQIQEKAYGKRTMVVLDSLHTYEHVSRELGLYGSLVSPGCYLVVEDTNVDEAWGVPAARKAAEEFIAAHPDYSVDRLRESHLLTFNPGGWIRRSPFARSPRAPSSI